MIARLRALAARVAGLLRHRPDAGFDDEMRTHLQLLTERYMRQGLAPADAASAARRQFGNATLLQEDRREMQTVLALEHAWRSLPLQRATAPHHARLHGGGDPVARARNRRQHGGLHAARPARASPSAGAIPGAARHDLVHRAQPRRHARRPGELVSVVSDLSAESCRVRQRVLQILQRRGDSPWTTDRAGDSRARVGQLLRGPARRTIGRPRVLGERRRSH